MTAEIAFVLGTRPEIIKLAPVVRACQQRGVPYRIVHTGQHYSRSLNDVFFDQLNLPEPDHNVGIGSGTHGEQTGRMLEALDDLLRELSPSVTMVQGDTNSVLAGAIAADKMDHALAHVEAGLRSFDRGMPEESNRRVADHLADYCFAPTETAVDLLEDEGIAEERVVLTGNTVVDALIESREIAADKSTILGDLSLADSKYAVLTAHRAENVDDPDRFAGILDGTRRVADRFDLDIVYPIHPRARDRLEEFSLTVPSTIDLIEPQEYLDFLALQDNATLVLTDSGGVQEETCVLGTPCVTVRDNTERPETITVGANELAGTDPARIERAAGEMLGSTTWENPFGDGCAAQRILDALGY